ncbi:MAG: tetratricopeptide repeat protein [Candidatus Hydrogenedentes bacterium]|nr:tetratricopeptide repeat protein [Candidatus Hydrogenedentota bacterium]
MSTGQGIQETGGSRRGGLLRFGWAVSAACMLTAVASAEFDPLDVRIASFSTESRGVSEFADDLERQCGIVCGVFIRAADGASPSRSGAGSAISVTRTNGSAREILDEAIQQAPAYVWVPVSGNLINLLPRDEVGKPDSVLNGPVSAFAFDNAALFRAVFNLPDGVSLTLAGHESAGRDGKAAIERRISCSSEGGTFLDAINALFQAAGNDLGWRLMARNGRHILSLRRVRLSDIVTEDRAVAEAYLADGDAAQVTAISLFRKAVASAPNEPLRATLELELAKALLGEGIQGASPRYQDALPLLERVVQLRIPELWCYPDALSRLVKCMEQVGRAEEAKGLLSSLLESEEDGLYFRSIDVLPLLIDLQIDASDPEGSVRRLETVASFIPGDEAHAEVRAFYQGRVSALNRLAAAPAEPAVDGVFGDALSAGAEQ